MKVYVDELPKNCAGCPCESDKWCNLMGYVVDEDEYEYKRPKQCPLHSLDDYTKQVRKEVAQEFRDFITKNNMGITFSSKGHIIELEFEPLLNFLNQIQGE